MSATIADYIEKFYNPQRRHSHLDYVSPLEFELRAPSAAREAHEQCDLSGAARGPLMHVIAAKAVAFKEAMSTEFRAYQAQVVENASAMADTLTRRGLRIVSGRTESHLMLVDLRSKQLTGKEAEALLGRAHITCNKNGIPNDPQKPMITSGIRRGSPAMTTRGFRVQEAITTANLLADVLDHPYDEENLARVRAEVNHARSPLPRLCSRQLGKSLATRCVCAAFACRVTWA